MCPVHTNGRNGVPQLPEVSLKEIEHNLSFVMPRPAMLLVSAKTGVGIDAWIRWLRAGEAPRRAVRHRGRWRGIDMRLTIALVAAAISIGAVHALAGAVVATVGLTLIISSVRG